MRVNGLSELDFWGEFIPGDSLMKIKAQLKSAGLKPENRSTYRKACQEGWASAPTNEFQKAIWDKVHAVPKNPMKKRVRPEEGPVGRSVGVAKPIAVTSHAPQVPENML